MEEDLCQRPLSRAACAMCGWL